MLSFQQSYSFSFTTAKILHPLLEVFQTERPMLPFIAEYIYDIMHIILEKLIRKSIMEKATLMAKLAKVDVMEKRTWFMQRMQT